MAEEVKKIITIEVGKSITSVRDFKKHIEDLRGALLGLNEDSEEYATIAEQIATDQAKLNDVMKIGKTNTDAAAGSYNELNNQLKSLRQQYKALSETERNSTSGQAILQNITKLDTQLKDIDESMGQYYRNVGNYKGAFEEAFKAISKNIGNINPEIGRLMQTASSLIPLIKKATTAATTGLKGVKAAMASTGIGLLVVALGEIIANWESIYNWIQKVIGKQKELTNETRNTNIELNNYISTAERLSQLNDLLSAKGYSRLEILREQKKVLDNTNDEYKNLGKQIEDVYSKLEGIRTETDTGAPMFKAKKLSNEYRDAFNFITKTIQNNPILNSLFGDGEMPTIRNSTMSRNGSYDGLYDVNSLEQYLEAVQDKLNEKYKDLQTDISENNRNINNELERLQTESFKIATDALRSLRSEEENLKADFDADIAQMKEYIKNTEDLDLAIEARTKQYERDLKELRKRIWESSDAYKDLQQAKNEAANLYSQLADYGKSELQLLDEQYLQQYALLARFYGPDDGVFIALTKKYNEERQAIIDADTKEGLDKMKQAEEEALQVKRDAFQKELDMINSGEFLDRSAAETMWTIKNTASTWDWLGLGSAHETDENLEAQKNERLFKIAEQGYLERIDLYHQYLSTLEEGSEEYLTISKDMHQEEMELAKLQYDYQVELEDKALAKKKQNLQIAQGMFQAYGNLASTIAGVIADSSEEGTKKWKAARITETVINTISGAAGAFMQGMSSYPQPWGAIIGAAGAAVATATGAAEIAKIKATQIGSSSVSGLSASSGVGVEPLLNPDYDLQRITNLSLQSDAYLPGNTQVYVLESDIQEVGRRVEVREQNATF